MQTETVAGVALETWTPAEVAAAFDKREIVIIDVRTPFEHAYEHIPGALLAAMHSLEPDALPPQDRRRIVFHCGSGKRSRMVAEACIKAGFDTVAHMDGGFAGWKEAGLPYIAIDPATGAPRRMPTD